MTRTIITTAIRLAAAAVLGFAAPALAQAAEDDLSLEATYTVDLLAGSGAGGVVYVDNLDITATARFGDTQVFAYALYNNGRDFSGPRFPRGYVASNIETGVEAVRLYEAWIDQTLGGGRVSLRAGLYDLNSEFDTLEASSLFFGPAHGIGTDISQSGNNGPSIFPVTSLAVRLAVQLDEGTTLRAAVLDGVPGDPAHPKRTAIKLGKGDGALLIAEADRKSGDWRLIAGYWRYTARFEDFGASLTAGLPMLRRGSQGAYLRGEGLAAGSTEGRGIDAFFRLGWADARFHETHLFASAGLRWRGLLLARSDDEAGIALTHARSSAAARRANAAAGDAMSRSEWSLEATYALKPAAWLRLQPHVQFAANPAYEPGRRAWMGGLRIAIASIY